jgi:hypothetical protein
MRHPGRGQGSPRLSLNATCSAISSARPRLWSAPSPQPCSARALFAYVRSAAIGQRHADFLRSSASQACADSKSRRKHLGVTAQSALAYSRWLLADGRPRLKTFHRRPSDRVYRHKPSH